MPEQCCGKCQWFVAPPPPYRGGDCIGPLPDITEWERMDTLATDGTTCPCFEAKETPNDTDQS